jgi:hypothetical protein
MCDGSESHRLQGRVTKNSKMSEIVGGLLFISRMQSSKCQRCILCWFWCYWMLMWFYYAAVAPELTCEENKNDVKQIKPLSSCFSNADRPKATPESAPGTFLRPCPEIFQLSAPEISAKTDVLCSLALG